MTFLIITLLTAIILGYTWTETRKTRPTSNYQLLFAYSKYILLITFSLFLIFLVLLGQAGHVRF